MAWNKPESKSLQGTDVKSYPIGPGAPISITPSKVGRPYVDNWSIERAYQEGMKKVVWVFRAIDAIAGNQSRLPVILRKDNDPKGEILKKPTDVTKLLNTRANVGENAAAFRYRVSSQLLMSTRGVFIEKVFARNGELQSLNLLPPQHTAPIPHPKTFVSGYEVTMPGGGVTILKPENVLWIRKPHPLDPYLSLTPLESAGIAIEIENLAKQYNRNFLQQDGRPGMMFVIRDEVDPDDREELEGRFSGGPHRAGRTTVVGAEGGIDVIDMSANPRDAAYIEMRKITKEEILGAFGVPESAIGNASGRSFANASEEMRIFWLETMVPHLEFIARALDELDDDNYLDFDTSEVPILILVKQERERHLMDEVEKALMSPNEYRVGTGRKEVDSELADSLLANPNLTPIANTKKKFVPQQQAPIDMPVEGAQPPTAETPSTDEPPTQPEEVVSEPQGPIIQASLSMDDIGYKDASDDSLERWTEMLDMALTRLHERMQRVVEEKASGPKMKRPNATVDGIFNVATWDKQVDEDLRPILKSIAVEATKSVGTDQEIETEEEVNAQIERIQGMNETLKKQLAAALATPLLIENEEEKSIALRAAVVFVFTEILRRHRRPVAASEAHAAWNGGVFAALKTLSLANSGLTKTWISKRDDKVRTAHVILHGKTIPVGTPFFVNGELIRYPGDPLAPPSLTIGCRCKLRVVFNSG